MALWEVGGEDDVVQIKRSSTLSCAQIRYLVTLRGRIEGKHREVGRQMDRWHRNKEDKGTVIAAVSCMAPDLSSSQRLSSRDIVSASAQLD